MDFHKLYKGLPTGKKDCKGKMIKNEEWLKTTKEIVDIYENKSLLPKGVLCEVFYSPPTTSYGIACYFPKDTEPDTFMDLWDLRKSDDSDYVNAVITKERPCTNNSSN